MPDKIYNKLLNKPDNINMMPRDSFRNIDYFQLGQNIDSICGQNVLPVQDAFISSTLELPTTSQNTTRTNFTNSPSPIISILMILSIIACITCLRNFIHIFPSLLESLFRWKGCMNIEESLQLSTNRNRVAFALILPFAMIISKYRIYNPEFMQNMKEWEHSLCTLGIFLLFIILRFILSWQFRLRKIKLEKYKAVKCAPYNFFILGTTAGLALFGISVFIGANESTIKQVLLYEIAFFYAMLLIRERQILRSFCNPFITILYLCIFEIFPTSALAASAFLL